jgi:hypothetical protein
MRKRSTGITSSQFTGGQQPSPQGDRACAPAPTSDLLDESAVRLLADFFILLAEWDFKQTNASLGDMQPSVAIPTSSRCPSKSAESPIDTDQPSSCTAVPESLQDKLANVAYPVERPIAGVRYHGQPSFTTQHFHAGLREESGG